MLYVKNFAIDHFLSKITWVLLKDSCIYPKITKILCDAVSAKIWTIQRNFILQFSIGSKGARDIVNQIAHSHGDAWETTNMAANLAGQHSLTSVERPSYLRSDFVNVWRHARLVVPRVTHVSFASIVHSDLSGDLMFVSRSCRCICLERTF